MKTIKSKLVLTIRRTYQWVGNDIMVIEISVISLYSKSSLKLLIIFYSQYSQAYKQKVQLYLRFSIILTKFQFNKVINRCFIVIVAWHQMNATAILNLWQLMLHTLHCPQFPKKKRHHLRAFGTVATIGSLRISVTLMTYSFVEPFCCGKFMHIGWCINICISSVTTILILPGPISLLTYNSFLYFD